MCACGHACTRGCLLPLMPQVFASCLPCPGSGQLYFPSAGWGRGRDDLGSGTATSVHIPGPPEGLQHLVGSLESFRWGRTLSPALKAGTTPSSTWQVLLGGLHGSGEGLPLSSPHLGSHPKLCSWSLPAAPAPRHHPHHLLVRSSLSQFSYSGTLLSPSPGPEQPTGWGSLHLAQEVGGRLAIPGEDQSHVQ